jgi:hypothetical protein
VLVGAILFTFSSLIRDFQERFFGSNGHQGCLVAHHDKFIFLFVRTDELVLRRKEERLLANVHPSRSYRRPTLLRLEVSSLPDFYCGTCSSRLHRHPPRGLDFFSCHKNLTVVLQLTKIMIYLRHNRMYFITFFTFLFVWIVARLVYFPFWVVKR